MPKCVRIEGNYEVVRVTCPACGARNVFSRVSDFHDVMPITYRVVACQEPTCGAGFCINSDDIGPAYKMFFYESYEFIREKRYSFAVLSAVQALEVFFAHSVRELWLVKRFKTSHRRPGDLDELNDALTLLYERTRKFSYVEMRNLFIRAALTGRPGTVASGRLLVESIGKNEPTPTNAHIAAGPKNVSALLGKLMSCTAHELRNQIIHKQAYRASREEAELAVESIGDILVPLSARLRVEYESL